MARTNLLIGGGGFIGEALSRALLAQGETVVPVGPEASGPVAGVVYHQSQLTPTSSPDQLLAQSDNVFILIGQTTPTFDADYELAVLEQLVSSLKDGDQKVFYFSTIHVYGNSDHALSEDSPCAPIGAYPSFKYAAEQLLARHLPAERLVIFRLTNVYGGPKNRGFIGLLMNRLKDPNQPRLILNGNGQLTRDYIFIDDVAAAVAAASCRPNLRGVINIATGQSYSLVAVVRLFNQVLATAIPYQLSPDMPAEQAGIKLINKKLCQFYRCDLLTPLSLGLKKTATRYKYKDTDE